LINIEALNFGLGDKNEKVVLIKGTHFSDGNHSLLTQREIKGESVKETIEIFLGDNLVIDKRYPLPNIIKIDVEGFELNVIKGIKNIIKESACKCIICEVHFSVLEAAKLHNAPQEIVSLLNESGFTKLSWLDRSHLLALK
jgi:FkbM family methyltransferase